MINITGVRRFVIIRIGPAIRSTIFSALIEDMVFGVISPNIRINSVSIPVASPTHLFPHMSIAIVVVRADAERLTILLPISRALSIFVGSSISFKALLAPLTSSSARLLIRSLFIAVRAVSDPEKNADISNSINNITARAASLESNKSSPKKISVYNMLYKIIY
jgi:hypothetical protein